MSDYFCQCKGKIDCIYCGNKLKAVHIPAVRKQRTSEEIYRDNNRKSKLCTYPKCRRWGFPIAFSDFYNHKSTVDKLYSWCKECVSYHKTKTRNGAKSDVNYRNNNREEINKRSSSRYQERDRLKEQVQALQGKLRYYKNLVKQLKDQS